MMVDNDDTDNKSAQIALCYFKLFAVCICEIFIFIFCWPVVRITKENGLVNVQGYLMLAIVALP